MTGAEPTLKFLGSFGDGPRFIAQRETKVGNCLVS
jgi:hypothetical protein